MADIAYSPTDWKDDAAGGTPITAAELNRMETGISDACAGVDRLVGKRLQTFLVASDGSTATQDIYSESIVGPCLVLDLALRATYYVPADGDRVLLTSGSDIDTLRDSVSQIKTETETLEISYGKVRKIGNVVFFDISRNVDFSLGSWEQYKLGTLPAGFRPSSGVTLPLTCYTAGNSTLVVSIGTDGSVCMQNASSKTLSTAGGGGSGCYPVSW